MLFLLLVLAGSLFLLPAVVLLVVFSIALADYLLGGGPAATTTGSNADPSPQSAAIASMTGMLGIE